MTGAGDQRGKIPRPLVFISAAFAATVIGILIYLNMQGQYFSGGVKGNSPFDEWWFGAPRTIYGWPIGFTWGFEEPSGSWKEGPAPTVDWLALGMNLVAWLLLVGALPLATLGIAWRKGRKQEGS